MERDIKYETEEIFQAACFQWAWNTYPEERQMLFHVQQKAKNRIEGSRFKAIGVVKGIADLPLILYGGKMCWIELKLENGTQSPDQISFQKKVEARGHEYIIVRPPLENFKRVFRTKLNLA